MKTYLKYLLATILLVGFCGCEEVVLEPDSLNSILGGNTKDSVIYYVTTDNLPLEVEEGGFNAPVFKHEYYKDKGYGEIVFVADVTTIGDSAFCGCETLEQIIIPDSTTEIGEYAFSDCENLTSIEIPESITKIGKGAFLGCEHIVNINIPNGITSIEEDAFSYCKSLSSIRIPNNVTEIGERAFSHCECLANIDIPDNVTTIGAKAFRDCVNLVSITIGESVTSIGNYALYGCERLTTIYCKPIAPPTVDSYMSANDAAELNIYVHFESIDTYKTTERWVWHANAIQGYDFE
jgi:hypothetical protein